MRTRHVVFGILAAAAIAVLPAASKRLAAERLQRERQAQRNAVLARITKAGGWDALERECNELARMHHSEHYSGGMFSWYNFFPSDSTLPPALAALKPQAVSFFSPAFLRKYGEYPKSGLLQPAVEPIVAVVRIKIFGIGDSPYYGLEVVCGEGYQSYTPRLGRGGVSESIYWSNSYHRSTPNSYHRISDRIYEIY